MTELHEFYKDFVSNLASNDSMIDFKSKLTTAALGLSGESGEIVDVAKKILFHGLPFDESSKEKLMNELSDVMWYVQFMATHVLECEIDDLINKNIEKLKNRYKSGKFTTEEFMTKEKAK